MLLDDVLCTAEPVDRLYAELRGARSALLLPEALHDELEVRRLDPPTDVAALDAPEAAECRFDLTGADLVEHTLDEGRVDRHCLARELHIALDRSQHGCSRRTTVESVEAEGVRKEARDPSREAVELGQRVLS